MIEHKSRLLTTIQPPFGDVDDRIRAIANALGLRTIIWQYDSNDWRAGTGNITKATVDENYQALIKMSTSGMFKDVIIPSRRIYVLKSHPLARAALLC